jgi:hypothetical protein
MVDPRIIVVIVLFIIVVSGSVGLYFYIKSKGPSGGGTTCENGGQEIEGKCVCTNGWIGTNCEYSCTGTCDPSQKIVYVDGKYKCVSANCGPCHIWTPNLEDCLNGSCEIVYPYSLKSGFWESSGPGNTQYLERSSVSSATLSLVINDGIQNLSFGSTNKGCGYISEEIGGKYYLFLPNTTDNIGIYESNSLSDAEWNLLNNYSFSNSHPDIEGYYYHDDGTYKRTFIIKNMGSNYTCNATYKYNLTYNMYPPINSMNFVNDLVNGGGYYGVDNSGNKWLFSIYNKEKLLLIYNGKLLPSYLNKIPPPSVNDSDVVGTWTDLSTKTYLKIDYNSKISDGPLIMNYFNGTNRITSNGGFIYFFEPVVNDSQNQGSYGYFFQDSTGTTKYGIIPFENSIYLLENSLQYEWNCISFTIPNCHDSIGKFSKMPQNYTLIGQWYSTSTGDPLVISKSISSFLFSENAYQIEYENKYLQINYEYVDSIGFCYHANLGDSFKTEWAFLPVNYTLNKTIILFMVKTVSTSWQNLTQFFSENDIPNIFGNWYDKVKNIYLRCELNLVATNTYKIYYNDGTNVVEIKSASFGLNPDMNKFGFTGLDSNSNTVFIDASVEGVLSMYLHSYAPYWLYSTLTYAGDNITDLCGAWTGTSIKAMVLLSPSSNNTYTVNEFSCPSLPSKVNCVANSVGQLTITRTNVPGMGLVYLSSIGVDSSKSQFIFAEFGDKLLWYNRDNSPSVSPWAYVETLERFEKC